MVLVSLLVDQLSGLFLIFFGRPKKICPVSDLFCSLSWIFCPVFFKKWEIDRTIGRPRDWPKPHFQKRLDKKFKRVNKKDLRLDKFFFGRPKKWEIDRTIGWPKAWPKPHGRDYNLGGWLILKNWVPEGVVFKVNNFTNKSMVMALNNYSWLKGNCGRTKFLSSYHPILNNTDPSSFEHIYF